MTTPEPRLVVVTPMVRAVIGELTRDGAVNGVIADRLGIAEDTVKSHVKAALRAVGSENRTAMVCALLRGQVRLRTESNAGRPGVPRQRRKEEAQ
jgi:DNA-binding NarL/FixJ family response regulator